MTSINEMFKEEVESWDLENLYVDLASAKGKHLTPVEKLHLRGLLAGFSPTEIAEKLNKNPQGVKSDLCSSIYKYVKMLVGKCEEKIENWRKIKEWLQEAGYSTYPNPQFKGKELLPDQSVVNITNVTIERNNLVFMINLKIPTIQPSDKPELTDEDREDLLE